MLIFKIYTKIEKAMFRLLLATSIILASPAAATELRPISVRTGTDGLSATPLTVANAGREPISCHADIAHWYSLDLTTIAPGRSAEIVLWLDPATGTFAALNDKNENLPVERLWCGLAGRAYATRAQVALDDRQASVRQVSCHDAGERLACR